jgi:rhodanese-related sulfurtransferase
MGTADSVPVESMRDQHLRFLPIEGLLEMKENGDRFNLIEVLSPDEYAKEHIPGARNIPEGEIGREAPRSLDREVPVVVYCASYHCQASTNAAKQLLDLGFEHVYDYKAGKAGWRRAGLEFEKGSGAANAGAPPTEAGSPATQTAGSQGV